MIYSQKALTCIRLSILVVLNILSAAYSQTNELSEIFVTANRTGQSIDLVLSEINVLNKSELDKQGQSSVSKALNSLPGFQGTNYGRHSVYLRGTDSRMTSVYVDGIRLESHDGLQLGGGAPWEILPIELVDHIEVVKGPASSMYGSDAMGGVVQLFTKQGSIGDRPTVSQSFGSFGLKQTTGQLSGKNQQLDYVVMLNTSKSDGYNTRPDLTHIPSKESQKKDSTMLKVGYDLEVGNRLEWTYLGSSQAYLTAPTNFSGGSADINNHNKLSAIGLQWQLLLDENNISRFRLNTSEVAADSNAPNSADLPNLYETLTRTISYDHQYMTTIGVFSVVLEKKQDKFNSEANLYNSAVNSSRSQSAIGAGYSLAVNQHILNASFRLDDYSNFPTHDSFALAYGYKTSPNWIWNISRTTGFRAPTLEQTFGSYGIKSLLPETNVAKEFAIQYTNGGDKARVSFFENEISNLISSSASLTSCAAGTFCYYNIGRANIQGVSISGQTKINDLNLNSSMDILNPKDQFTNKQLTIRSKQNFRAAVEKPVSETRIGVEYQYVGKRFDDAANLVAFPAYGLFNAWSKSKLSAEWTWLNRIDNIFDKKYQQYGCTSGGVNSCNYAMPGVTFFTSIQWSPK
jgi:vitamin B12 transporter